MATDDRSPSLPARILKFLKVLMGLSQVYNPDGLNNSLLS